MKFIRGIHAAYAMLIFGLSFLVFFPLLMIPIIFPKHHYLAGVFNRWWAIVFLSLIFIPFENDIRYKREKNKNYIFCPNHFSYMDIPSMGLNPENSIFVGKNDMEKIPFFGFMYKKLHITVDRNSLKSRYSTIVKSGQAIDEGKNLTIFPEGGILSNNPPQMSRFKDGAFRIAIEKQIDIIPVTIPFNWIILPEHTVLPRRRKMKIIYHEAISTKGLTLEDVDMIKQKTYDVISAELNKTIA
ncbi:lysophospholipid acyltransferase family protein [Fulvivirga sediminis]|uniref:1-acyl-sn-glycerol-3-phosphate acyltransferase n=1 Tax=Fulvivirga sediminis TaxID=2803949 RepID=A0A937F8F8_9BACT|nr:lysophospholipid acyltransferase family protein [Fulvivirga sediminis]MBL3656519.1 1-acyl-sn-glycerol-3-phosphate acyltransferase [Fulvivirga sediminis]